VDRISWKSGAERSLSVAGSGSLVGLAVMRQIENAARNPETVWQNLKVLDFLLICTGYKYFQAMIFINHY
jgi:hypothetical protein